MHSIMHPITQTPSDALIDAEWLQICADMIAQRLGLHYPPPRWADLKRQLQLLARDYSLPDIRALATLLQQPWSRLLQQRLIRLLTVGETYFFRDPPLYQHLRDTILGRLIEWRRAQGDLRLRLWSAGCCSGEEAYSLAMLVHDLIPDQTGWRIQIIGTDINPYFLQYARAGVFRSWSFRQQNPSWRSRYFQEQPDGTWHVDDRLRQQVDFQELNLVDPVYPDSTRRLADCDLILCRNVLMYFTPMQATAAIQRLHHSLAASGALILAPVEAALCAATRLATAAWPGAVALLRNQDCNSARLQDRVSQSQLLYDVVTTGIARTKRQDSGTVKTGFQCHSEKPTEKIIPDPVQTHTLVGVAMEHLDYRDAIARLNALDWEGLTRRQRITHAQLRAQAHANLGETNIALTWVEQLLALDKLEPRGYWLLANIEWERGQLHAAAQALSKALYLAPDFVLAHYLVGQIYARQNKRDLALHHFDISLMLMEQMPADSELPEGDGLSVAQGQQWLLMARASLLQAQESGA